MTQRELDMQRAALWGYAAGIFTAASFAIAVAVVFYGK